MQPNLHTVGVARVQLVAVQLDEGFCGDERRALVAIDEGMQPGDPVRIGRSECGQVGRGRAVGETLLRFGERGVEDARIAKS